MCDSTAADVHTDEGLLDVLLDRLEQGLLVS